MTLHLSKHYSELLCGFNLHHYSLFLLIALLLCTRLQLLPLSAFVLLQRVVAFEIGVCCVSALLWFLLHLQISLDQFVFTEFFVFGLKVVNVAGEEWVFFDENITKLLSVLDVTPAKVRSVVSAWVRRLVR